MALQDFLVMLSMISRIHTEFILIEKLELLELNIHRMAVLL